MDGDVNTVEPQYRALIGYRAQTMGLMSGGTWAEDPKRLGFVLARYKFAAKMLQGRASVLEIGCADAFASRVVAQHVGKLTAIDFDPVFVLSSDINRDPDWPIDVRVHDLLGGPVEPGGFDAAYALDVLEHVRPEDEGRFMSNAIASLAPHAVMVVGMPSLESQAYASAQSRAGHVNCKTGTDLRAAMARHFRHVLMFSMNDEVVHTGFDRMAHYLIAVGCEQI